MRFFMVGRSGKRCEDIRHEVTYYLVATLFFFRFSVPPPAPQGLEERGGVGDTRGLGLDQGDKGLLVLTLGVEQRQVADGAEVILVRRPCSRIR